MTDSPATTAAPREWRLASRPTGWPKPENFALAREPRCPSRRTARSASATSMLSVDPYMRGRMSDAKSYARPTQLGKAMRAARSARSSASDAEGFAVGDHVLHVLGWREYAVVDGQARRQGRRRRRARCPPTSACSA